MLKNSKIMGGMFKNDYINGLYNYLKDKDIFTRVYIDILYLNKLYDIQRRKSVKTAAIISIENHFSIIKMYNNL